MKLFWLIGLLVCFLASPVWADIPVANKPAEYLGDCPLRAKGIEIGRAYAEAYGSLPLISLQDFDKEKSYATEYAVYFNAINHNGFDDRLTEARTASAKKAILKKVDYTDPAHGAQAKYISPVEFLLLPAARPIPESDRASRKYLTLVEFKRNYKFIHLQDVVGDYRYGDQIMLTLVFENAGEITIPVMIRPRGDFSEKTLNRKYPWPDCGPDRTENRNN